MHLSVFEQGEIYYFAFVFGIALGVYYDFFRMIRYIGFNSRFAVIVQDILFMSTASILCFLFAQVTVNGHFRGFIMVGHILGFFSFRYSIGILSGYVFKFVRFVINKIQFSYRWLLDKSSALIHRFLLRITFVYVKFSSALSSKTIKRKKVGTK